MFFQLINRSIVQHLRETFQKHLSPHQHGILTPRDYETTAFSIKPLLEIHHDWVIMQVNIENVFNNVF
jgi:hypothetical protein